MSAVLSLSGSVGVRPANSSARASWYRARQIRSTARARPRPAARAPPSRAGESPGRALRNGGPGAARHLCDLARRRHLASVRTLYRLLASRGEVRERRAQRRHPNYSRPELLATAPNQLWSWDITRLKGPVKWTYFHLYVPGCLQPRVVGWMVAHREFTVGRAAHPAHLRKPRHPPRTTDPARRPRLLGSPSRSRCCSPARAPRPTRAPTFRTTPSRPVQDLERPTGLPRPVRIHRSSLRSPSVGTTTNTDTPVSPCSLPPTCTAASSSRGSRPDRPPG